MTPEQFKTALTTIGWSQLTFSRKTGVNVSTVSRWMTGDISQIPSWVDSYMQFAINAKQAAELVKKK